MTGRGSARREAARASTRRPDVRPFPDGGGRRAMPALGSVSTGSAPLPIRLAHPTASTCSSSRPRSFAATRRAVARISAAGRISRRRAGSSRASRSGFAYRGSRAPSAARVILSTRNARFIGLRRRAATRSARPATTPDWGPPSSLSPLKVTRSAPFASASRGVGSRGSPNLSSATRVPLPRSCTHGTPRSRAREASPAGSGAAVNPSTT